MSFLWFALPMCTVKQNITWNVFLPKDSYGGKNKVKGAKKRKTRKSDLTLRFKRAKQFFMHLMVTNGQGIRSAPCQDPLLQMCSNIGGVGGRCPVPSHLLLQIKTHTHTKQGFSECDLKPVPTRLLHNVKTTVVHM